MATLNQITNHVADFISTFKRVEVKLTNISGAASWSGKYYKDVDVSAYIPTGGKIYAVSLGSATNGGCSTVFLQDEATIRLLDASNFNTKTQTVYLLIGLND